MREVDAALQARWVLPVEPERALLAHHTVVIDQGRIAAVLPWREARRRYRPRVSRSLVRHVVMPGLVNAHTHAAMTLLRGFADDLPVRRWLRERIWPVESRHVSPAFVADGATLACAEMLRGGTTCFNDMYYHPEATAAAARRAGIRVVVGLGLRAGASPWGSGPEAAIADGLALLDRARDERLLGVALAPHSLEGVSPERLHQVRLLARDLGLRVHIHAHESATEVELCEARSGRRPLRLLERLGLLGPRLIAVHMTQLDADEIQLLAARRAHVVHCPESNLKLASGFCPVAGLLARGVNVALGTDGAASNDDLDLWGEMRTAALLAKAVAGDAAALPAWGALRMATLNGARALGLDAETGSLRPGKSADCIAVDLGGVSSAPLHDIASQLVYATTRDQVDGVWVAGEERVSGGRLLSVDGVAARRHARSWRYRIAGATR